jgi:hypothetical protein
MYKYPKVGVSTNVLSNLNKAFNLFKKKKKNKKQPKT